MSPWRVAVSNNTCTMIVGVPPLRILFFGMARWISRRTRQLNPHYRNRKADEDSTARVQGENGIDVTDQ